MTRITDLTAAAPAATDVFPFDAASGTRKATLEQIREGLHRAAVSTDADNKAMLGTNGLVLVPRTVGAVRSARTL